VIKTDKGILFIKSDWK